MGILENLILLFIAVVVGMIFHKILGEKKSFNLIMGFLAVGTAIAGAYLFFTKGEFVYLGAIVVSLLTSVIVFLKATRLPK